MASPRRKQLMTMPGTRANTSPQLESAAQPSLPHGARHLLHRVTMGVPSDGSYGIPAGIMYGVPVTCEGGQYKRVEGLAIDEYSRTMMDKTLAELQEEQAGVASLLG